MSRRNGPAAVQSRVMETACMLSLADALGQQLTALPVFAYGCAGGSLSRIE